MAHIDLPDGIPGIRGPMATCAPTPEIYRQTGKRLANFGYVASTEKAFGA